MEATFVVRVWVSDRPGALGQVASRIGAVRGDVIGIEILERAEGQAIDELVVTLPDAELLDLLIAEVSQVDGVSVEDVRPLRHDRHDPQQAALAAAVRMVGAASADDLVKGLCDDLSVEFECDWVTFLTELANSRQATTVTCAVGDAPPIAWLAAFIEGSSHLGHGDVESGPDDIAWARLDVSGAAIAVGRRGRPLRWRERRQLAALCQIADGLLAGSGIGGEALHGPVARTFDGPKPLAVRGVSG